MNSRPTLYWWTNWSNGCCWTMPVKIHFAPKGFSICIKTWNIHCNAKQDIKYLRQWTHNRKYLYISNGIFKMNGYTVRTREKLRCFLWLICYVFMEISGFTVQPFRFYVQNCYIYFSWKVFMVLHQSKKEWSNFDQKLARLGHYF